MSDYTIRSAPATPGIRVSRTSSLPIVVLAGILTTAASLAGVWMAASAGENVMGWYASYIIPVGAFMAGIVASIGFGVSSWKTGAKITGILLVATLCVLFAGYWLAQYIEYGLVAAELADGGGAVPGFFEYYDFVTRSFAWQKRGSAEAGNPLGLLGYGLRALELVGFMFGGVLAPLLLKNIPYCSACGMYMRRSLVAIVPAGLTPKKISKKKTAEIAAREEAEKNAYARGQDGLDRLIGLAQKGDAMGFVAAVAEEGPLSAKRKVEKLTKRIRLRVVHCRGCLKGHISVHVATGQGKEIKETDAGSHPLAQGAAPRLLERPR